MDTITHNSNNQKKAFTYHKALQCQGLTIKINMPSILGVAYQNIQAIMLHIAINRPKATICIDTTGNTKSKPNEFVTFVMWI